MKTRLLFALALLVACASAPKPPPPPLSAPEATMPSLPPVENEQAPLLQLPEDVRPTHYTIVMEVDPDQAGFTGHEDIALELSQDRRSIWLHGRDLTVSAAWVEQGGLKLPATYEQLTEQGVARVTIAQQAKKGPAVLHLDWTGAWNPRLKGLYRAAVEGVQYAFTQFEAIDARYAFPSFDEPRFKTPFDMTLVVPRNDVAVSNTPDVESRENGGRKSVRFATTRPLPTYLVAWAVGPFDVVTPPPLPPNEVRNHPLQVRGIAPKGQGEKLGFALEAGGGLLVTLEKYFGIAYPYEKLDHIAVPDFAVGAMENAGAITYRDAILLFDPKITPETLKARIAGVMAHEMAHQWFGDLVTLPWWTDTWLNEAFATWMGNRAVQTFRPEYQAELHLLDSVQGAMASDALVSARKIRQPLLRTEDVWNQFDSLTYEKGAAVIGMFERWAGEDAFRRGIHDYLTGHAYGSGSNDAFLDAIARASGKPVQASFKTFLEQPGVPLVEIKVDCAGTPKLSLTQSRYLPLGSKGDRHQKWDVPVCARYGEGKSAKEACTLLTGDRGEIALDQCPGWVMPNAGAAGYYRWALDPAALTALRTHGYSQLSVPERLSFANNLEAAVQAGALGVTDMLGQLGPIVKDPSAEVASSPLGMLGFTIEHLVSDANRPRAEKFASSLYGPLAAKLGWKAAESESLERRGFRAELLGFLAQTARDPKTEAQAAKLGQAALAASDGTGGVDPDLYELALTAAVQTQGQPAFDAILTRLDHTTEGATRSRMVEAMGANRRPELARRALDLALDKRTRKNEKIFLVASVISERETRQLGWEWLQAHFDQLAAEIPDSHASEMPFFAIGFCDQAHLDQVKAFFGPRAEKSPGMPRALAQAEEHLELCIAQKAAQQQSANAFFASGHR
jgi:alanyl aminopeptidase